MVGIGEGIAIFAICGTVVAAIIRFTPSKNGNKTREIRQNDMDKTYMRKDMCSKTHEYLSRDVNALMKDVKTLLKHFEIQ